MLPILNSTSWDEFSEIYDFLRYGTFGPKLDSFGSQNASDQTKERLAFTHKPEMNTFGLFYDLARKLEIPGLQGLIFEKLKLLVPFRPVDLLYVVDDFFNGGDSRVQEWLIEYIAEHFFELMRLDGITFADKVQQNKNLSYWIFKRMDRLATKT